MLKEVIDIELVELRLQRIIKNYGTSLTLNSKEITYRINTKVQDRNIDGIEIDDPYIMDSTDTFFPQRLSRITKERVNAPGFDYWRVIVEFDGTNQMIQIFGTEKMVGEIYDKVIQFKKDYDVEKEANNFIKLK
jgi:hypothetical protein